MRITYFALGSLKNANMMLAMKCSKLRSSFIWFVMLELLWLTSGFTSVQLKPYIQELYKGSGLVPFSMRWGWQTLPWLAVLAVATDYLLNQDDVKMGAWHRKWRYVLFVLFGILYLLFSFFPLSITIGIDYPQP